MKNSYVLTVTFDESKNPERAITERLMNVMCELSGFEGVHEVKLVRPGEEQRMDFIPGIEQQRSQL